nr:MAG TPA: hypothetical protein [Caudoviricetes sp.]
MKYSILSFALLISTRLNVHPLCIFHSGLGTSRTSSWPLRL